MATSPDTRPAERKRHHFVPVTYLRGWAGTGGKLHAYVSDRPDRPLHVRPEEIGFEKYYYSHTREDGSRDNDSFEELFGTIEARWPLVRNALDTGLLGPEALHSLYSMLTLMRTRVPAARDYNEALMALETRTSLKVFAERGKLPTKLKRYEGDLDTVEVTVNRQRTLATMSKDMGRFAELIRRLGFEILCDKTGIGFLTSDNPVAYYDPGDPGIRRPYIENDKVELYFPLSPHNMLHGSTRLLRLGQVPRFKPITDVAIVRKLNRITARFAYRLAFAADRVHDSLVLQHAATSPVLKARVVRKPREMQYHIGHQFASRPLLPKFRSENCVGDLYEEDFYH